jgi:hypothetical protein
MTDYKKMSDEELKEAVALFMGYRWYNPPGFCSVFVSPEATKGLISEYLATTPTGDKKSRIGLERTNLPDWLYDRNHAAEVEKKIKEAGHFPAYIKALIFLAAPDAEHAAANVWYLSVDDLAAVATASARLRCEAMLRIIKL